MHDPSPTPMETQPLPSADGAGDAANHNRMQRIYQADCAKSERIFAFSSTCVDTSQTPSGTRPELGLGRPGSILRQLSDAHGDAPPSLLRARAKAPRKKVAAPTLLVDEPPATLARVGLASSPAWDARVTRYTARLLRGVVTLVDTPRSPSVVLHMAGLAGSFSRPTCFLVSNEG